MCPLSELFVIGTEIGWTEQDFTGLASYFFSRYKEIDSEHLFSIGNGYNAGLGCIVQEHER